MHPDAGISLVSCDFDFVACGVCLPFVYDAGLKKNDPGPAVPISEGVSVMNFMAFHMRSPA